MAQSRLRGCRTCLASTGSRWKIAGGITSCFIGVLRSSNIACIWVRRSSKAWLYHFIEHVSPGFFW